MVPPSDADFDRYRLLILFSPSEQHPHLQRMRDQTETAAQALADRDMQIVTVFGEPEHPLRSRYGIPADEFSLILVGKDGGIKRRVNHAVALDDIFRLVDSMPMRRRELRERGR